LFGEVLAGFLGQYVSMNSFLDWYLSSSRRDNHHVSSQAGKQWLI